MMTMKQQILKKLQKATTRQEQFMVLKDFLRQLGFLDIIRELDRERPDDALSELPS